MSSKLRECGEKLRQWNKHNCGNFQRRIRALKQELTTIREGERTEAAARQKGALSDELDEWLAREELLWKQRSRMTWLKGGEHNATFFKVKETQRKERK